MDILAPVFAYLTCVAGLIGAFLLSFSLVFSAPKQPQMAQQTAQHGAVTASVSAPKPALPADTKSAPDSKKPVPKTAADNPPVNHVAANTQKREEALQQAASAPVAPQLAASQKPAVAEARSKGKITRAQWRQIVAQERSRRVAYQQGADFDSRFLGYAD